MRKLRYWRVDSTHKLGYNAPSTFIETEEHRLWKAEEEALEIAKSKSRLSDYPQSWTFSATLLDRVNLNGKWYTPYDYSLKTGLIRTDSGRWVKPTI